MYEGWDNIAVNGASVYIRDTMDRQGQLDFSSDLNGYFLQKLAAKELIDDRMNFMLKVNMTVRNLFRFGII